MLKVFRRGTARERRWFLRRAAVRLIALLTISAGLRIFVARGFVVTGNSMEPTLLPGDFVFVNSAAVGRPVPGIKWRMPGYAAPERFDLFLIRVGPTGGPQSIFAKRLVGMPGDELSMSDGVLHVNGHPIEEPYVVTDTIFDRASVAMDWQLDYLHSDVDPTRYFPTQDNWGPLEIPPRVYFFLGDNRHHSIDSREFGLISHDNILGRLDWVLFSHNASCCNPTALLQGVRWGRIGLRPGRAE